MTELGLTAPIVFGAQFPALAVIVIMWSAVSALITVAFTVLLAVPDLMLNFAGFTLWTSASLGVACGVSLLLTTLSSTGSTSLPGFGSTLPASTVVARSSSVQRFGA